MAQHAQAQAQEVREEEITGQESMELYFRGVDMRNLEDIHVKAGALGGERAAAAGRSCAPGSAPRVRLPLSPPLNTHTTAPPAQMLDPSSGDEEVQMLVNWVERGVVDAIQRRYLKRLFFGFSEDPEAKRLLEEYVFSFSYNEDGYASFDFNGRGRHSGEGKSWRAGRGEIRHSGAAQAGGLAAVCRRPPADLGTAARRASSPPSPTHQVPEERALFMKLTYYDHTPEDYEPPYFRQAGEAGDSAVAVFARNPFSMQVGRVATKHHQVALHVKSVLDMVVMEGEEQMVEDNISKLEQTTYTEGQSMLGSEAGGSCAGGFGGHGGQEEEDVSCGGYSRIGGARRQRAAPEPPLDGLYTEPQEQEPAAEELTPASDSQRERELGELRSWLAGRASVHLLDAMARFGDVSVPRLEAYLRQLQADGLLLPTDDPETMRIAGSKAVPPAKAAEAMPRPSSAAECEVALQNLTVREAAKGAAAAPRGGRRGSAAPQSSEQGGVWDAAGTQATQSALGPPARALPPASQRRPVAFLEALDGSQPQSVAGAGPSRQRKLSIVKEPIRQTGKRKGRPEPRGLAGECGGGAGDGAGCGGGGAGGAKAGVRALRARKA
eukprot:scaffold3.g6518.t1